MGPGAEFARALAPGFALAVQFNPLASLAASIATAVIAGFPKARVSDTRWGALVLALGWLLGDGTRIAGHLSSVAEGASTLAPVSLSPWTAWVVLGAWALGGLAVGYVLPASVGVTVGRRVTWGTGRLAAAATAGGSAAAIIALAAAVGR